MDCHTPRRNADINSALEFTQNLFTWAQDVGSYLTKPLFRADRKPEELDELRDTSHMFVPIVPVFLQGDENRSDPRRVLSTEDMNRLLDEQLRSLHKKFERVNTIFGSTAAPSASSSSSWASYDTANTLMTNSTAKLIVLTTHINQIVDYYHKSVGLVEGMLFRQLIKALGKTISPQEFNNYVSFHNQRLLLDRVSPVPFSYSVRRGGELSPEGLVSIESYSSQGGSGPSLPVRTIARSLESRGRSYMNMPLTASTSISIGGSRTVHGWIHHTFGSQEHSNSVPFGDDTESFAIIASARQFSSYILVLGRVTSSNSIDPMHAIVVKDKDYLKIPLNMEVIVIMRIYF